MHWQSRGTSLLRGMALLLGVVNHFARSGSVIFSKDPDPDSRSMSRFEPSSLPSPRLPHISSLLLHTTYLLPHQCHAEAASEGPRISATIPECPISLYNESGQNATFLEQYNCSPFLFFLLELVFLISLLLNYYL